MDTIGMISVLVGSVILLGVFFSIAFEGVTTKRNSKKSLVSALNHKWQKLTVSAS